jgi:hypothetical protein
MGDDSVVQPIIRTIGPFRRHGQMRNVVQRVNAAIPVGGLTRRQCQKLLILPRVRVQALRHNMASLQRTPVLPQYVRTPLRLRISSSLSANWQRPPRSRQQVSAQDVGIPSNVWLGP